ncbi:MAG: GNAT family N-acetyltransferase [Actinobacteria bacterium]|nr:MAG: GNAT family N-acetyltransferase [Actinomycetota bacterium]
MVGQHPTGRSLRPVADARGRARGSDRRRLVPVRTRRRRHRVGRHLGVRPQMQRRGIGSALLRSALADLSRRGLRIAELNVDSQNESGAVDLYRKVGMTVVWEWLDYVRSLAGAPAPGEPPATSTGVSSGA